MSTRIFPSFSESFPGEFDGGFRPNSSSRARRQGAGEMFEVPGAFVSPIGTVRRGLAEPVTGEEIRMASRMSAASSSTSSDGIGEKFSGGVQASEWGSAKKNKKKRTKQKAGAERFVWIEDTKARQDSQSEQIKQAKLDLVRLLLTTGCQSCLLVIPPSWRVHKFATAGDFNSFLEMYAAALAAQRKMKCHDTKLRIDDVWQRFHNQGGLREIESLCSILYDFGCDTSCVEEFKDAYLESLAGIEHSGEIQRRLASRLHEALRSFIADVRAP